MFARFDENPAMTLQDIQETKRYWRTDGRTHARTDRRTDNVKTVYPPANKVCGGYNEGMPNHYYSYLKAWCSNCACELSTHSFQAATSVILLVQGGSNSKLMKACLSTTIVTLRLDALTVPVNCLHIHSTLPHLSSYQLEGGGGGNSYQS